MITIQRALRSLNVTGKYRGFHCTAAALGLILQDEDWLFHLKGKLYPRIAAQLHCTDKAVKSAISYFAVKAWKANRQQLETMARTPLYKAPSNTEFLTMLYNYIKRS